VSGGLALARQTGQIVPADAGTTRLLTFDEKHFRAIRPLHADAFTILAADDRPASA